MGVVNDDGSVSGLDNLTLLGQGDATVIDTDEVDPFTNNGNVNNGFEVVARSPIAGFFGPVTGVTIEGFRFDTVSSSGNNDGIGKALSIQGGQLSNQ